MQSKAATVDEYMRSLPDDRRAAIEALRAVFKKNLDKGFEEGMNYGMIGYYVPHAIYPASYHCNPQQPLPFACIASQKNAISVYLMSLYMREEDTKWFVDEWKKTGKKLDMGKSCIRAKSLEGFALDVIGDALKRTTLKQYIETYESILSRGSKATKESPAKKKLAAKKAAPKKATAKSRKS